MTERTQITSLEGAKIVKVEQQGAYYHFACEGGANFAVGIDDIFDADGNHMENNAPLK